MFKLQFLVHTVCRLFFCALVSLTIFFGAPDNPLPIFLFSAAAIIMVAFWKELGEPLSVAIAEGIYACITLCVDKIVLLIRIAPAFWKNIRSGVSFFLSDWMYKKFGSTSFVMFQGINNGEGKIYLKIVFPTINDYIRKRKKKKPVSSLETASESLKKLFSVRVQNLHHLLFDPEMQKPPETLFEGFVNNLIRSYTKALEIEPSFVPIMTEKVISTINFSPGPLRDVELHFVVFDQALRAQMINVPQDVVDPYFNNILTAVEARIDSLYTQVVVEDGEEDENLLSDSLN